MTENLPKHRASRARYRAHLTQILEKAGTLMAKETPTEVDLVSLKNILEQLAPKKDKIKDLDERIAAVLEDPDEIEKEAFETEVIQDNIDETSSQISNFLDILSSKKTANTVPLALWENHYLCLMETHQEKLPQEVIIISPHR